MLSRPLLISPNAGFWPRIARALLNGGDGWQRHELYRLRVIVPAFSHAQLLKAALADELQRPFIPPRITTLPAWIDTLTPEPHLGPPASGHERLMGLYAELRQHAWLKKLFSARRNPDLLPLAQTLVTLFDELTQALLPSVQAGSGAAEERWTAALEQLSAAARHLLSDEAQLVWSLWQSQLDTGDTTARGFARMLRLAEQAEAPLVWIGTSDPDAMESAFLAAYAQHQPVLPVLPDWRAQSVPSVFAAAWREILEEPVEAIAAGHLAAPAGVALSAAGGLEDEALRGAQTVIGWLEQGKSSIAIVAQDRVVARRIRALLERAHVYVFDETGWKLSTTRTAAAIDALFTVAATRGDTTALLDLLKSPFVFAGLAGKAECIMAIESGLRRANVLRGWGAALAALEGLEGNAVAQDMLRRVAEQARSFAGRKSLVGWALTCDRALQALSMGDAFAADAAGAQVLALLESLRQQCVQSEHEFSFAEWRTFIGLQFEATPFVPADFDRRVVMLQLNGTRLRRFDAVLMVGADAAHLPSQSDETLFFANAVRRELGLATREMRTRRQLRDVAALMSANCEVVLSWQACRDGEPNPVSPWVERLQLALERTGADPVPAHSVALPAGRFVPAPVRMPAPVAPHLLPQTLTAGDYNSLVACPYQFFATRMLALDTPDELSDLPEKRDYGDWLHRILMAYHEAVRDRQVPMHERAGLLQHISRTVFDSALARNAAALSYFARWQKAMPAYLEWANDRERRGWHFAFGEQKFEKVLQWNDMKVTLQGRIDRIDYGDHGEWAVLDYKTSNLQALRERLKDREDHQLAFYAMVSELPVTHAHYVALEPLRGKTGAASPPDLEEWQRALEAQLGSTLRAVVAGAPLPANGTQRVCRFCEVRGLCRKGAWQ
jgi:ATP-dependent helicase/nuclease subunit B